MFKVICSTEVLFRKVYLCKRANAAVYLKVSVLTRFCRFREVNSAFQSTSSRPFVSLSNQLNRKNKKPPYFPEDGTPESQLAQELADKYTCSAKEVNSMIKKCPNLLEVPLSKLCYNAEYFKTLGLRKRTLVSYPWILAFSGASTQSHRLNCVQKLHSDINVTAPLLQMPLLRLQKLCSVAKEETHLIPGGNRINYLSQRLHCEPVEICQTAAKHPFILAVSFDHLESVLSLLADAGVAPQHILKDTWVFRYNIFTIESRLNQAKEAGIKKIKPWVVRCPQATLDRTVEKHVSSRELLGSHPSVVSYLCHRLECSAEMLEFLSCKAPQMLKVNVPKLKEVLDFLYQEGFTPQQVCQVPRVLNHSLRTLQTRLKQLRSLDYNPNSLIVLCQTKRQYRIFVEKLISVRQKCAQSTS